MADLNEQIVAKTESIVEKLQIMYDSLKGSGGNGDEIFKQFCERSFTEINFPKEITTIGNYAFCNCNNLTTVTIPDSVTSIGNNAFNNCSNLESVVIGDGVTSIDEYAFYNCSSLTSITIPDSVTSIGNSAFRSTAYYENGNNWVNEVLYIGKHLIQAKETISGEYLIKDDTLTMANSAFERCSKLESVMIPDSITSISKNAFSNCSNLLNASIGNSVTSIGDWAFYNCSSLPRITIPDSVTSVSDYAFYGCTGLEGVYITNLYNWCNFSFSRTTNPLCYAKNLYLNNELVKDLAIPKDTKEIKPSAFCYCESLERLTLPDGFATINNYVFYNCSNLKSITIPVSVTSIGYYAFNGCNNITDVYYAGSASQWEQIKISSGNDILKAANIHYNENS